MVNALFLSHDRLDELIQQLDTDGWQVVGPQLKNGTLLYHTLERAEQLPWGVHDKQQPGSYRIEHSTAHRAFAWANGPQAIKPFTFAPRESLWQVSKTNNELKFEPVSTRVSPTALLGVRSCDLAALALQDQHFLQQAESDSHYAQRRESLFIIAVNCSHPADTCFCAATGDGPAAATGYDLLLDELDDGFVLQAGSKRGEAIAGKLSLPTADAKRLQNIEEQRARASSQQRTLPASSVHGLLSARADSPRWDEIAQRCLSCGNCTAVCPSCFCHSEHDEPQLDGMDSTHIRQWDSCFSADHSLLHGHSVRDQTAHRYRQWLTHKFDYWHEQAGRSGCVGCGRCITWCPVGIDVVEELHHFFGGEA